MNSSTMTSNQTTNLREAESLAISLLDGSGSQYGGSTANRCPPAERGDLGDRLRDRAPGEHRDSRTPPSPGRRFSRQPCAARCVPSGVARIGHGFTCDRGFVSTWRCYA
jgi:hypothetical protein